MTQEIVVGSSALNVFGLTWRKAQDLDVWGTATTKTFPEGVRGDYQYMPKYIMDCLDREKICDTLYATPDMIYTIKLSHLGWDIFWTKHKRDCLLLEKYGARLDWQVYNILVSFWGEKHGNKDFLSLNKNKEDFFTDKVEYIYDHDYIHELVAYPNRPVYEQCLKEGQQVYIDKNKFFAMPFEKQIRMFREEMAAIALERWLLNPKYSDKVHWAEAWQYAFRKTVTSLTKGWATDFIVLNLRHFDVADFDYFKHALETLGEYVMKKDENARATLDHLVTEYWNGYLMEFLDGCSPSIIVPEEEGFKFISQDGGGEGGAEYCETVFKCKDIYYKATYSYYSHYGYDTSYMDVFQVTPKTKTITVFE